MRNVLIFLLSITAFFTQSCTNNTVIDNYHAISNHNWTYNNIIKDEVEITDTTKNYNIYINFRHTDEYKYSNLWVRTSVINPAKEKFTERKEFLLAMPDGKWLGKGSGNLYSYELLLKENIRFDKTGKYIYWLEQNMRDNPLVGVSDIGLRIVPVE